MRLQYSTQSRLAASLMPMMLDSLMRMVSHSESECHLAMHSLRSL